MKYYIITGTSRGLGEAFARELMTQDCVLFCISRNKNEFLIKLAKETKTRLFYYSYDLTCVDGLEDLFKKIFEEIDFSKCQEICLINNAGVVAPVMPAEKCKGDSIVNNITLNQIAPMILSSFFISQTSKFTKKKSIINISSGAGRKPYYGWSSYCTSKAGLDMFSRVLGVEETGKVNPVKVMSIAPGIIDTEMQEEIRNSSVEDFPLLDNFIDYKEKGVLSDASEVAKAILKVIENGFEQGAILDIRDFMN